MHRWWLPSATFLIFVLALLLTIPYAAGYEHDKLPLGILLYKVCTAEQGTHTTLDFSYCLMVPVIVAVIIYMQKEEIARQPIQGVNGGMWLVVAGLLVYLLGLRAEQQVFGYAGMQIMLAGMILWLWGWAVFRQLLFVWAFFAFFWPLPFLDSTVAFPLRKFMTTLAFHTLNVVGVPTIQSGTALMSAANPLSGLQVGRAISDRYCRSLQWHPVSFCLDDDLGHLCLHFCSPALAAMGRLRCFDSTDRHR